MLFNDEFYIVIYDNVIEDQISCSVQLRLCINEAAAPGDARREVGLAQAAMYQCGGEGG
jgi:hypothetical protein